MSCAANCPCNCHGGGAFKPACNLPGGCGSTQTAETVDELMCVLPHRADDEEPRPRQFGLVCKKHRGRLDRMMSEIRRDWIDAQMLRVAGSAPKESGPKTKGTKSASPPAPANLDLLVLRDARSSDRGDEPDDESRGTDAPRSVPFLTEMYCRMLIDERPLTRISHRWVTLANGEREMAVKTVPAYVPNGLMTRLDMLTRHLDWICSQDWVDEFAEDFGKLQRNLKAALRDKASVRVGACYLPAVQRDGTIDPEQRCGGALLRKNGEESVKCFRCRQSWVSPRELATLEVALNTPKPTDVKETA